MEGDSNAGSSSSSAIKKRKKTSEVWDEMTKYIEADGNVKAECKHCKKTFDGSSKKGTTHLKNHLERCPANPKRKSGSDGRDGDDQHQSLSPSIKTKELASLIKEISVRGLIRHLHDTKGKVKAECNHCKKTFDADSKKGTSHLNNHLQRCPANPKRKSGSDGRDGDDQHQSLSPSIKTKELARLIKETSVFGLIKHFSSTEGDTSDEGLDPLSVLNSRKDEILQLYQEEKEKICQFLNNLSCRFTLQLVYRNRGMDHGRLLEVNYIDDSWERQSKIISFWRRPRDHIKNLTEAVTQSCMDWKIDTNICSVVVSLNFNTADGLDNEIGKMESWFSQRRSLPFAGCPLDAHDLWDYVGSVLESEDYVGDGIRSLKECAAYVQNKSTSDKVIQLDSAVEIAISKLEDGPSVWGFFWYFEAAVGVKEVFSALEQFDSEFRSINLSKQKWDEVTAAFEHLKFLEYDSHIFTRKTRDIPIIVDLPYVHKILTDRCNHRIEDCLFCQEVMKGAIDLFFSKHYLVRVIAVILDPRFKMDGLQLRYKEIYGSDADRYLEKVNKDFRDVL